MGGRGAGPQLGQEEAAEGARLPGALGGGVWDGLGRCWILWWRQASLLVRPEQGSLSPGVSGVTGFGLVTGSAAVPRVRTMGCCHTEGCLPTAGGVHPGQPWWVAGVECGPLGSLVGGLWSTPAVALGPSAFWGGDPPPTMTMEAEPWDSAKLGFQELYLRLELLALWGSPVADAGPLGGGGSRLVPRARAGGPWAVLGLLSLGCPGPRGAVGCALPYAVFLSLRCCFLIPFWGQTKGSNPASGVGQGGWAEGLCGGSGQGFWKRGGWAFRD